MREEWAWIFRGSSRRACPFENAKHVRPESAYLWQGPIGRVVTFPLNSRLAHVLSY